MPNEHSTNKGAVCSLTENILLVNYTTVLNYMISVNKSSQIHWQRVLGVLGTWEGHMAYVCIYAHYICMDSMCTVYIIVTYNNIFQFFETGNLYQSGGFITTPQPLLSLSTPVLFRK